MPQPNHEPFRVFNWSSSVNAAATTMSGAFTQIEPRRTNFGDPYAVRTEQEFVSIARDPVTAEVSSAAAVDAPHKALNSSTNQCDFP